MSSINFNYTEREIIYLKTMKTYITGRNKDADIVITDADRSVCGFHLELIEDTHHKYYVIDRKSANGTYRKHGGRWVSIQQSYVNLEDWLLLGKYPITVRQLLAMYNEQVPSIKDTRQKRLTVKRDPETGEIIPQR
jgi:pSer/pThr/pTyr-binding forkhead associated (FHA) protein